MSFSSAPNSQIAMSLSLIKMPFNGQFITSNEEIQFNESKNVQRRRRPEREPHRKRKTQTWKLMRRVHKLNSFRSFIWRFLFFICLRINRQRFSFIQTSTPKPTTHKHTYAHIRDVLARSPESNGNLIHIFYYLIWSSCVQFLFKYLFVIVLCTHISRPLNWIQFAWERRNRWSHSTIYIHEKTAMKRERKKDIQIEAYFLCVRERLYLRHTDIRTYIVCMHSPISDYSFFFVIKKLTVYHTKEPQRKKHKEHK